MQFGLSECGKEKLVIFHFLMMMTTTLVHGMLFFLVFVKFWFVGFLFYVFLVHGSALEL
jgi:hypothetical protein